MKAIEIADATKSLGECAQSLGDEPLVIMREGKPVAVLLGLENADQETVSLSSNPRFIDLIERSRSRHRDEGGISSPEVRSRLGIK